MNSSESFWALDKQLLHQWGNDMVAEMGYLELLQSEPLRASSKQIVQKLSNVTEVHKIHVELYRRALSIFRTESNKKSRVADLQQGLMVAEKVVEAFLSLKLEIPEQRTPSVVFDQTQLNNLLIFTNLLLCHELGPKQGKVQVSFRRRANYLSTTLALTPKKPATQSGVLLEALNFLSTTLNQKGGALELRSNHAKIRVFLRLPISKQLKLI